MKILNLSIYLLFFASALSAQFMDNVQDPPEIDWKTINTKHFEIIFPSEINTDAQRVANLIEHLYLPEIKTMDYPFKKLTLLLSTHSAISNGYVTLAPRRSEWYATPFQLGSDDGDWYELLATHEMRHVAQYGKLANRGINKVWKLLGGELYVLAINGMLIPRWFWEGDAVLMETLLSKGGRGRKPDFDMGIRALHLNGRHYSYYKSMLGSYKDFVPNPYPLGYLIVSYARKYNDEMIWSDVLGRSAFLSFFPFAFSASLKGLSGQNAPATYESAMEEFRLLWQEQQDSLNFTSCQFIKNESSGNHIDYKFPQMAEDGFIYALKSGLADAPTVVQISIDGTEVNRVVISPMYKISVSNHFITWATYNAHIRWGKQNYSDIVIYDLNNKSKTTLTHKGKYFTPALSADATQIAAVEFSTDRKSRLVILDRESGDVIQQAPNPENKVIKSPSWSSDGTQIVYTAQSSYGKSVCVYNLENDQVKIILLDTWLGITYPVFWKNYILFSSGLSGIDNIYAIDINSGQPYQVTSRPFGAFNPFIIPDTNELLFNDYSEKGHKIAKMTLESENWLNIENIPDGSLNYFSDMIPQEQGGTVVGEDNIPHIQYPVTNYQAYKHLLNFHSWQLYPDSINLGAYFVSNDILNTTALGIGAFFNRNESSFGYALNVSYGGFYPIIDFKAQRLHRTEKYQSANEIKTNIWYENTAALGMRIPFNFSSGSYQRSLMLSVYAEIVSFSGRLVDQSKNKHFFPLLYTLNYAHVKRYALKDVRRQSAQMLEVSFEHTPFKSDFKGKRLYSRLRLYSPGAFRHHSLLTTVNYEWQNPLNYSFQPLLSYPRGYDYQYSNSFIKVSFDYAAPLFYPDFSISAWFYLKRIKANLFYDYGLNFDRREQKIIRYAGLELLLDHHWFSFPIEFEGGYRFSYRQEDKKIRHEIIFQLPLD